MDEFDRLYDSPHEKPGRQSYLRSFALMRYQMNMPLLIKHSQLKAMVAWKKYDGGMSREKELSRKMSVDDETQMLLRINGLLNEDETPFCRTG